MKKKKKKKNFYWTPLTKSTVATLLNYEGRSSSLIFVIFVLVTLKHFTS